MFWKRHERETFKGWPAVSGPLAGLSKGPVMRPLAQLIEVERDVPRAVAISRNAEELRWNGEEVVELFKEVTSPVGRAVLPIHLKRGGENVFVEVETGPWKRKTVRDVLKTVAVVRNSEYADAVLEVSGAYPVPEEVRYLCEQTPAALFQLDLIRYEDLERAEDRAEAFRGVAEKHWGLNLNFDPEKLALVEDLLLATLEEGAKVGSGISGTRAPVLDALIRAFGCYVGEVLRRHASPPGSWRSVVGWGEEGLVVAFPNAIADPIGKSRAFLENGLEDSAAYYVSYALKELKG
jgi:hypothetical protein